MAETADNKQDAPSLTKEVEKKTLTPNVAAKPAKQPGFRWPSWQAGKQEVKLSNLNRITYPLTILLVIMILSWFMYFLYNNVYETIALGQNITALKTQVVSQNLNENDFNKIVGLTQNKNAGVAWQADKINNPFIFAPRLLKAAATASAIATATSSAAATATTTR